jgi:SAM-dependent methyltransferase
MKQKIFKQYQAESNNWLKRGRRQLLHSLLQEISQATRITKPLEILEVGPGVGQNVPALQVFGSVEVIESNEIGLTALRNVPGIKRIYDTPIPFSLNKNYDIICALDVIEHIENDYGAAQWLADHLKPGGFLIATVPAYQWLFSEHDIALGHYRRYTKHSFKRILPTELVVVKSGYFNSILFFIPVVIRVMKRLFLFKRKASSKLNKESSNVPDWLDLIFYKILLTEIKIIEKKPIFPFGLSVFCIAQKIE